MFSPSARAACWASGLRDVGRIIVARIEPRGLAFGGPEGRLREIRGSIPAFAALDAGYLLSFDRGTREAACGFSAQIPGSPMTDSEDHAAEQDPAPTRADVAADIDYLHRLRARLERTNRVIERGSEAFRETIELLKRPM